MSWKKPTSKRYVDDISWNSGSIKQRVNYARKSLPKEEFPVIFSHSKKQKSGPAVKGWKQLPLKTRKKIFGLSLD